MLNFLEEQTSSQNFEFQCQLKKYVKSTTSKHQVFILGCKVAVKHTVGNQSSELVTVGQLFYDSQSIKWINIYKWINFTSNIFGGGEEQVQKTRRLSSRQGNSDVLNQTAPLPSTPANSGKKLYRGQRDNDIFGIRERTTGEASTDSSCWIRQSSFYFRKPR